MPSSEPNRVDWDAMDPDKRAETEAILAELQRARKGEKPMLALPGRDSEYSPDNRRDNVLDAGEYRYGSIDPYAYVRRVLGNERRKTNSLLTQAIDARRLSSTDLLTGLSNRRAFRDGILSRIAHAKRKDENLYLLMLDVDFFKKVNDRYGHAAGDVVLRELGAILKAKCRIEEQPFRLGGEEFAVLLDAKDESTVSNIAERIRSAVKEHNFVLPDGVSLSMTISLGFCKITDVESGFGREAAETADSKSFMTLESIAEGKEPTSDELTAAVMYEMADRSLYAAKESGRNRVVVTGSEDYKRHKKPRNKSGTAQGNGTGNEPENKV